MLSVIILFKSDVIICVYREYLELLRDKRQAIEDYREFLEQLVVTKRQNEENERELEKMRDV